MSGLLYFIPRPRAEVVRNGRLVTAILAEAGLDQILDDVHDVPDQCVAAEVAEGPNKQPGTILYPVPSHREIPDGLTRMDGQRWREVPGESYLVGWYPDAPPRAVDLERNSLTAGYLVKDGEDDQWSIPVLRSPDNPRGNLGFCVNFDGGDLPVCGVTGKHRDLWEASARLWDLVLTKGQADQGGLLIVSEGCTVHEDQFVLDCVFRGLAINYRLDRHVLAILTALRPGWLSQLFVSLAANALVDMIGKKEWESAQKKTGSSSDPAGVSLPPGERDGSITDPAGVS